MPYVPFGRFFPDLGLREKRSVVLGSPEFGSYAQPNDLPADEYHMVELYCDEPGCDCRRVMFNVISGRSGKSLAFVTYGWESTGFYARWLNRKDPEVIEQLKGPALNIGSPQSRYATELLELIEDMLLADPAYTERLKRHYRMFREVVEQKIPAPIAPPLDPRDRKRVLREKMRELQARRSQKKRVG